MNDTTIVILIGVGIWLVGFILQRKLTVYPDKTDISDKVEFPGWLVKIYGGRSNYLNSTGFSIQLFGEGFILGTVWLLLAMAPGKNRVVLGQLGFIFLYFISFMLPKLLIHIQKKKR